MQHETSKQKIPDDGHDELELILVPLGNLRLHRRLHNVMGWDLGAASVQIEELPGSTRLTVTNGPHSVEVVRNRIDARECLRNTASRLIAWNEQRRRSLPNNDRTPSLT